MEKLNINTKRILNNGVEMPVMGLGVYKSQEGTEVEQAIAWALEAGYRLIDTAAIYGNEGGVGKAVLASRVPREEIFVTTKLWNTDQGYENALRAVDLSLQNLNLSYVDLYLVHWPSAEEDRFTTVNKREETWRAMEHILASGKAKAIGVSNYTVKHLEELKKYANILPAVNQVEFHPFLHQKDLLKYCNESGIVLEAYAPLVKARKMDNDSLTLIAQKYGKTNAQVLIRWSLQKGCIPIPKSVKQKRIKENIDVFDFELSAEDMAAIDSLDESIHQSWNPEEIA
ncbi:MAG: Glyoxal reductase [Candidatus Adlerbacteria bacterium]|nr:Glyoxal reductase [Candidatus Adlerbacteria bacterium]